MCSDSVGKPQTGHRKSGRTYLLLCLMIASSGCGGSSPGVVIEANRPIPASESVVFGDIEIDPPCNSCVTFNLVNLASSRELAVLTNDGPHIYMHLPPGEYAFLGYRYTSMSSKSEESADQVLVRSLLTGSPSSPGTVVREEHNKIIRTTRFTVPGSGQAVYIGKLKFAGIQAGDGSGGRPFRRSLRVVGVVDEFERARLDLLAGHPGIARNFTTSLMTLEEQP